MIPTQTLRQRIEAAMYAKVGNDKLFPGDLGRQIAAELAQAAINAIGDPALIKTADSLEPIFPLRAQDLSADQLVFQWACMAQAAKAGHLGDGPSGIPQAKIDDALEHAKAFRAWPTRKWPD